MVLMIDDWWRFMHDDDDGDDDTDYCYGIFYKTLSFVSLFILNTCKYTAIDSRKNMHTYT